MNIKNSALSKRNVLYAEMINKFLHKPAFYWILYSSVSFILHITQVHIFFNGALICCSFFRFGGKLCARGWRIRKRTTSSILHSWANRNWEAVSQQLEGSAWCEYIFDTLPFALCIRFQLGQDNVRGLAVNLGVVYLLFG